MQTRLYQEISCVLVEQDAFNHAIYGSSREQMIALNLDATRARVYLEQLRVYQASNEIAGKNTHNKSTSA